MTPDVLMMTALTVMWAALVGLLWIVWRLHQRLADLEQQPLLDSLVLDVDDDAWAAVTEALDCCTDMERTPA
jgi:hypothetical protein